MSSLNDSLGKISILEVLIVILAFYGITILFDLFGIVFSKDLIYVALILYFIYRLRFFGDGFKQDFKNIFSDISPKYLLLIVLVNVFFSYGMLYLSIFALDYIPGFKSLIYGFTMPHMALFSLASIGGVISTVVISPICEELLFRGVFLNRLKLFVPLSFAVVISSILFGALHGYGNIISAFVFGICMCIIYLKTHNILTCIFAHFMNNLFAEIIVHMDTGNLIFTNDIFIALFSILAIVSLYLIINSIRHEWKYINKR
jgi:hypothetical protein